MSQPVSLGPLRHECHACGNCCHGHFVPLLDAAEVTRIEGHAATLGVPDPIEDGGLRRVNGACVFLGSNNLCTIHAKFGMDQKPLRCQLWPLKVLRTEGELRIGVDPGCTNAWRSFEHGEELEAEKIVVRDQSISPGERQLELALIGMAGSPGASIGKVAAAFGGQPSFSGPGLPDGMAERLLLRLKCARLPAFMALPGHGDQLVAPMFALAEAVEAADLANIPDLGSLLPPESDAFARDVIRRRLFLREAPMAPAVHGLFAVMLAGVLAAALTDPALPAFGPRLSHWSRLAAQRALWLRLFPEPELLRWVATGQYSGQLGTDYVVGARNQG